MTFDKYKIHQSFDHHIETHEVFLDSLAHIREEDLGISEKKLEVKINEKFIYALFGIFFLLAVVFFAQTFYFQIIEGSRLKIASINNRGSIALIRPERGIVYDKQFTKLVVNGPAYDLVCKKNILTQEEDSTVLTHTLKISRNELEKIFTEASSDSVLLRENIDQTSLLVLESKMPELEDCQIEKNTVRDYLFGPAFAHVLGYNGRITKEELGFYNQSNTEKRYAINDYVGKVGLEKFYETYLRGIPGTFASSQKKTKEGERAILSEATPGNSLVLHLDAELQKVAYASLEKSIKNVGAQKGAAVAVNPKTGAILALVSYPSYDNNIFSRGISVADYNALQNSSLQPFFNRAISAQYPVGSTIKPLLAVGALEEGIITPEKKLNDTGYISIRSKYDPRVVYTFSGVRPHGWVDMRRAIAVSSNIYFFTIGGGYQGQRGLGPTLIKKYLDIFGWEEKTGIDLPGEFKGFVPGPAWKIQTKKEPWWDGDTYNLSIGQSDLQVTPLHVAMSYAAIANGGTLYKPQIVDKIITGSPENPTIIRQFQPEVIARNILDDNNLRVAREGMLEGVQYGSSKLLADLPVQVAGKTGTAETNKVGYYSTWSSNFAPYDDPEIVFVITIESVKGFQSASLPVAREVLDYYFKQKK